MGMFTKESGIDVLDLTLLQKRGLLKMPQESRSGIIDLTAPQLSPPLPSPHSLPAPSTPSPTTFIGALNPAPAQQAQQTPLADNPFSMLDTLAGTSSNVSPQPPQLGSPVDFASFNVLRLKLDDVEYKLERLVEKFSLLDERLRRLQA